MNLENEFLVTLRTETVRCTLYVFKKWIPYNTEIFKKQILYKGTPPSFSGKGGQKFQGVTFAINWLFLIKIDLFWFKVNHFIVKFTFDLFWLFLIKIDLFWINWFIVNHFNENQSFYCFHCFLPLHLLFIVKFTFDLFWLFFIQLINFDFFLINWFIVNHFIVKFTFDLKRFILINN